MGDTETGVCETNWFTMIMGHWGMVKPAPGFFSPLFPRLSETWRIRLDKKATRCAVQATLNRLMADIGCAVTLTTHSPRSWYAELAKQLLYTRGDKGNLGHWDPGVLMPDRYDRAARAEELRLRDEIFAKIRDGWVPPGPFETPGRGGPIQEDGDRSRWGRARRVILCRIGDFI